MINNIMVEVLGAFAQEERNKIRKRQAEGIAHAKSNGVKYGRPEKAHDNLAEMMDRVKQGVITVSEACRKLNISRTQWYRLLTN